MATLCKKMSKKAIAILAVSACMFSTAALSAPRAYVDVNMATLTWQLSADGKVWFRNLNTFSSAFQAGNYNYYLDTTTPVGKSFWAMMLLKIASGQTLNFTVFDPAVIPSVVDNIGNY